MSRECLFLILIRTMDSKTDIYYIHERAIFLPKVVIPTLQNNKTELQNALVISNDFTCVNMFSLRFNCCLISYEIFYLFISKAVYLIND